MFYAQGNFLVLLLLCKMLIIIEALKYYKYEIINFIIILNLFYNGYLRKEKSHHAVRKSGFIN